MKTRDNEIKVVLDELFPLFANGSGEGAEKKKRQYSQILKSLTAAELRAVLQYCLLRQNFIPTICEIKAAITQIAEAAAGYHMPTADEALAEVLANAQRGKKSRYSTEVIEKTVKTIGYQNILLIPSGGLDVFRAHWRQVYDTFVRREADDAAAKNVLRSLPQDTQGLLHDTIMHISGVKMAALPPAESSR